jgi:TonB family protein
LDFESKLEEQAQQVQGLGNSQDVAEERFLKLLGAMESAWSQGPRQLTAPAAEAVAQPLEPRRSVWKRGLGFAAAALILATVGAAQFGPWSRSPELPVVRPIMAPVLAEASVQPVANVAKPAAVEAEPTPKIKQTPTESAAMLHQISLEIPDDLKSAIKEQALVNVSVAIDPKGKVTTAEVESTKGEEADLLTDEALRVARRFRFRPGKQGSKNIASQMILTFVFDPELLGN